MSDKKNLIKNIAIIVLAVIVVVEGVFLVISGTKSPETEVQPVSVRPAVLSLSLEGLGKDIMGELTDSVTEILSGLDGGVLPSAKIIEVVKGVLFSDMIVSTVMSLSYPLLFNVLTDLKMMDFSEEASLYPTGSQAAKLLEKKGYTCCDKDGARKPLEEVLNSAGSDWSYMDSKVTWTDENGREKTTTLWNSIRWGIHDEASFYKTLSEMSEGLRGVLEVCLQSKEVIVNVNAVEAVAGTDIIPLRIDAATIYNSSPKSGYEMCLVPLFNMLGLSDGDYPSAAEFSGYTSLEDVWRGIFNSIFKAVEKALNSPMDKLPDMLVSFAAAIDDGSLVKGMRALRMDATFNKLASLAMGFKDGLLYNLGEGLIEIIESMGIKLTGSFNQLLDSLMALITKNPSANMPDMDVGGLKGISAPVTLPNGTVIYDADGEKVIDYLIEYVKSVASAVM